MIACIARYINLFFSFSSHVSYQAAILHLLVNPLSGNNDGSEKDNRPVLAKNLALAFLFLFSSLGVEIRLLTTCKGEKKRLTKK